MFNYANITAAIGAILISAACVTAAVGPAAAEERAPVQIAAVQAPASAQVNA
ncbi:MAG: hypothetical protein AB7O91_09975 [Sphingomonas sp.]